MTSTHLGITACSGCFSDWVAGTVVGRGSLMKWFDEAVDVLAPAVLLHGGPAVGATA